MSLKKDFESQTQGHTRNPSQPGDPAPEGTRRIAIRFLEQYPHQSDHSDTLVQEFR